MSAAQSHSGYSPRVPPSPVVSFVKDFWNGGSAMPRWPNARGREHAVVVEGAWRKVGAAH